MQVQITIVGDPGSSLPYFLQVCTFLKLFAKAPGYLRLQATLRVLHTSTGIIKGIPPSPGVKKSAQGWSFSGLLARGVFQISRLVKTRRREDAKTRERAYVPMNFSTSHHVSVPLRSSGPVTRPDKRIVLCFHSSRVFLVLSASTDITETIVS